MRDRTKQITLDFTKHPKAKEIYDDISGSKVAWVAEAIEEKDQREKGIIFTPEQEQRIIEIIKEVIGKWQQQT